MTTQPPGPFILVHGAWMGKAVWEPVAELSRPLVLALREMPLSLIHCRCHHYGFR